MRTPYPGRYFYIRARTALGTQSCELPCAGCAVQLHLLVERGGGKSTRDLQIFRAAYRPGEKLSGGPVARPSPHSRTVPAEFDKSSQKFFCFYYPMHTERRDWFGSTTRLGGGENSTERWLRVGRVSARTENVGQTDVPHFLVSNFGVHPKIETGIMVTVLDKENTCHKRKRSSPSTERS